MRVVFVERDNAPERLVCEAEVVFEAEAGPLAGMKLVGFSLWRSPEGEVYVTFPSRAFGSGTERRFFDFLRSVEGTAADAKRVKAWILESLAAERGPRRPPGGSGSGARGSRRPRRAPSGGPRVGLSGEPSGALRRGAARGRSRPQSLRPPPGVLVLGGASHPPDPRAVTSGF